MTLRLALAMLALLSAMPSMARAQSLEYRVKANYLIRFAAFVDWPGDAFANPTAPITLCIAGKDPFGAELDRAAAGQTAHGRKIALRRGEALAGCHILYAGAGAPAGWAEDVRAAATLTVTDEAVSPERGMIHFVLAANRVRFHADQAAAVKARLTVDSRLLALALSVKAPS